ncbi:squamosa promoter-binding-like protein 12 [Iris pallida]|uniref:Squamosa promoter-binding-like protein 12 n=1 Tax=Iris pallida TaxID=29817 RepID=A0AAX6DGE2_IRIPA|nr:squamosa promoter-binding-like protein 12 [Iris pallida]
MDWSAKSPLQWDWETPGFLGGRECEISILGPAAKPVGNGSLSGLANGSSKSSVSASIDSSSKEGGTSAVAAAVGLGEPLIGLKLGRRTYFEDVCAGSSVKNSSTSASVALSSASAVKKTRVSSQSVQSVYCQVEGCNVDLTGAKDYHRKHRVCENHSKSPKVVVAGQERRFCQQCSRFHDLSEFDQKKRSCRRRLSDHNARRRKPQRDTITFNSSRLCSPFYDDPHQMNFLLDRVPFGHGRPTTNSTWENSCGFSLTDTKGSWVKSAKPGSIIDGQLHFSNSLLSDTVPVIPHELDKLLSFKGTNAEVLNQGMEASVTSSNMNGTPELQRALSLLSNDSWGSANPMQANLAQFVNASHNSAANPTVQAVNTTTGFWQDEQSLPQQARVLPLDLDLHSNGGQYQEFQLLKAPFEATFFDSSQMLSKPDGQFLEFKT